MSILLTEPIFNILYFSVGSSILLEFLNNTNDILQYESQLKGDKMVKINKYAGQEEFIYFKIDKTENVVYRKNIKIHAEKIEYLKKA